MNPPNELALQLAGEWIEDRLEPKSVSSPRNPRAYAQFKSASVFAKALRESSNGGAELPNEEEIAAKSRLEDDSLFNDGRFITKTTVHRLYREISDLIKSYENISDPMTVEMIIEEHDLGKECEDFPSEVSTDHLEASIRGFFGIGWPQAYAEAYLEINLANRILPFFTLAQVVIEDYSISLLHDRIIDQKYYGLATTTRKLEKKLSQPGREMLLQRTGLISGDFRSEMEDVRRTRNNLVHSLREIDYFEEVIEAAEEVEKCVEIISGFESQIDEEQISW